MTLYELLKTLHVIAAVLWVGGGIYQAILAVRAQRRDLAGRMTMIGEMEAVAARYFPVLSMLTLIFGILLMAEGDIGIGEAWIGIAIAGWVISSILGAAYFGPTVSRVKQAYEAGDEARAGALYGRMLSVMPVDVAILVLVVADMVIKPG